ncbi:uncharacterized protein LOC119394440 [Rhipicephalus sanguineus]|uniref:uncharacterized protein LOC119394440 n=1 Tax=Rhipicephalus sanguineus TaxID=34632 RepID=UPI001892D909|nr:uncharacterized protein LOC119394440 [Rhipicephalus sanguineus]
MNMLTQRGAVLSSVALVALSLVSMSSALAILACPPVDDWNANATLIANPLNCSTFFMCQQGIPVLMTCPGTLHFNDVNKTCDYASRAGCVPQLPTFPPVSQEPTEAATGKIVDKVLEKEVVRPVHHDEAPGTVSEETATENEVPAVSVHSGDDTQALITDTVIDGSASTTVQPVQDTVTEVVERDVLGSAADDVKVSDDVL